MKIKVGGGNITNGYCVVIATTSSSEKSSITGPDVDGVIDWVTIFGSGTEGEGNSRAPMLPGGDYISRSDSSCDLSVIDTDNNANDFMVTDPTGSYMPKNSSSPLCSISSILSKLLIYEVGSNVAGSNNDYVVIYNPNDATVDLTSYYIGRDNGCSTSSGIETEYVSLAGTISSKGYFLITKSSHTFGSNYEDQSWGGDISAGDCVVIATLSSGATITGPDSNGVIDWVTIGAIGSSTRGGEGGGTAPPLIPNSYISRSDSSCDASVIDTNNNLIDFAFNSASSSYMPNNKMSPACTSP